MVMPPFSAYRMHFGLDGNVAVLNPRKRI